MKTVVFSNWLAWYIHHTLAPIVLRLYFSIDLPLTKYPLLYYYILSQTHLKRPDFYQRTEAVQVPCPVFFKAYD